jgi:hypothetical protein
VLLYLTFTSQRQWRAGEGFGAVPGGGGGPRPAAGGGGGLTNLGEDRGHRERGYGNGIPFVTCSPRFANE